ncbi:MAG: single-stranded-DNA-specific exonuclease RecJ [Chloroflexi bacterium]|nr:single-stranded-DNA-specific exonuclease RecJ [Chloroflexota bacterium]
MPPKTQRWNIMPRVPPAIAARFSNFTPLLAQILFNRGLVSPEQAQEFFAPESQIGNPFQLHGMNAAVERLRRAIKAREPIAVYGDFDVDGVTATALLTQTLQALGADVQPYIPHRIEEGYGLNLDALKQLKGQGVGIVVTVDSGIRSLDEVAFGKKIGLDMIVTDHHTPGTEPPDALAVINPKQAECAYPFKELSGSGVAFKLAQALLRAEKNLPIRADPSAPLLAEDALLDLVALGTVADLVPLTGENRALVKRGIEKLRATERPGIRAMLHHAVTRAETISAGSIGYVLGPRLNAAGRIDHALNAYHLLTTLYPAEADKLAQQLESTNRERQRMTQELTAQARARVAAFVDDHLLFVAAPEFPEGIIGLIAGRISEEFYRPAVAVHVGEVESRGSARSISEFNIIAALDECKDLLVRHGGHAAAAGFTVRNENLAALEQRLRALARQTLADRELARTIHIDAEAELGEMNWDLQKALEQLAPFGYGNREPVFASRNVTVRDARVVGTDHLKLTLSDGKLFWDAIAFRQGRWLSALPKQIDMAYQLDAREWNGRTQLQLNVSDIKPSEK